MKKKISSDLAMQAELGMISKYASDNTEEINKSISNVVNPTFDKVAGIYISDPTQENIEDFVRKYMYNELTFFPRVLDVFVLFEPSTFDKQNKTQVDTGSGLIKINVRGKDVEIPFMISEGQLNPFDVIQMDGQRVPFSRDNLQKILINLDKQIEMIQTGQAGSESPYTALDNYANPSTIPGFMGDVLSIRDSQATRRGASIYTVAESEYTEQEKLAFFGDSTTTVQEEKTAEFKEDKKKPNKAKQVLKSTLKGSMVGAGVGAVPGAVAMTSNVVAKKYGKSTGDTVKKIGKMATKYGAGAGALVGAGMGVATGLAKKDKEKKASEDLFNGMPPFPKGRRKRLEEMLDEMREKVEREKPTTKCPNCKED